MGVKVPYFLATNLKFMIELSTDAQHAIPIKQLPSFFQRIVLIEGKVQNIAT